MLKSKKYFFKDLRGLGVIERNYSFTTRSNQITLNATLFCTFSLLEEILELGELPEKIKRFGKLLVVRSKRLSGANGFDMHVLKELLEFYPSPF